jgi:hypothetical protein
VTQVGETPGGELGVGHVDSLWEVSINGGPPEFFADLTVCTLMGLDDFYEMRQLQKSGRKSVVNFKVSSGHFLGGLN